MADITASGKHVAHPDEPPPRLEVGVLGWLRKNLFSSVTNAILTLLGLYLLYLIIPPVVDWAIINAHWEAGTNNAECSRTDIPAGACWTMIRARFGILMYGFYPSEERWRVDLTFMLQFAAIAALLIEGFPFKKHCAIFLFVIYPFVAIYLLLGGAGIALVETSQWGGLMLNLVLATTGIVASLPIGILLALGRRSRLPIIRILSVAFIEFVRGVPLITVLFMASVVFPLFMPEGVNFNKLLRVVVGIALFSAAYLAEVIRGGLQAIPKGQYEGAMALGLNYWKTNALVILPQALRISIPGIVNSFIGLFMDTTLVVIVGQIELLGMAQSSARDPNWLGTINTALAFVSVVFFVFCFSMSRYSQYLERKLYTGHRR
ncbi:MAG TPA: amino acid ABC transporter permease [Bradyrhizobium sp.]|nr:amino acid ABC transporter permease [Bradyrhizobium sp.]